MIAVLPPAPRTICGSSPCASLVIDRDLEPALKAQLIEASALVAEMSASSAAASTAVAVLMAAIPTIAPRCAKPTGECAAAGAHGRAILGAGRGIGGGRQRFPPDAVWS